MSAERRTEVDGLVVDRLSREVELDGERITLNRREFDLLSLLATEPSRVFTSGEISTGMYGVDTGFGHAAIRQNIRRVRGRIGPRFMLNVRGVGYRLLRDVTL